MSTTGTLQVRIMSVVVEPITRVRIRETAEKLLKTEKLAGRLGFEPRLTESESAVLPLDDLPPNLAVPARFEAGARSEARNWPFLLVAGEGAWQAHQCGQGQPIGVLQAHF